MCQLRTPVSASEGHASEKMRRLSPLEQAALPCPSGSGEPGAQLPSVAWLRPVPPLREIIIRLPTTQAVGGTKGDPRSGGKGDKGRGGDRGGKSDRGRHHKVMSVTVDGGVTSGGSGGNFILTATSSTVKSLLHTLVTVDVTTSTAYTQPGVSSPTVLTGELCHREGHQVVLNIQHTYCKVGAYTRRPSHRRRHLWRRRSRLHTHGHKLNHLWAPRAPL